MGALHVLFASLAFLAATGESHRPRLPSSEGPHHSTGPLEAFSALWHYNEVCPCSCPSLSWKRKSLRREACQSCREA